jgi:2-Cys peroxiredoxin 5
LGDPTGKFSEALDVTFDSSTIFGNHRSKRYALLVEDGKVKEAFVEPDNTGLDSMTSTHPILPRWRPIH